MIKYHAEQTKMWDAWFLNVDGTLHAFHLQMPLPDSTLSYKEAWSIGHAVSEDLLHWKQLPSLLPPLQDDKNPLDYHSKFTGCTFQKDDTYYLFYTMRDKDYASQRIGLATSTDTLQWTIYENNPLIEPDPEIFTGYGIRPYDWGIVDCRDMLVVRNPADGLYYGYFAAAANLGSFSPCGVIAVAVSDDLIHWRDQKIAYIPRTGGIIEVPDVYFMNGKWYLTVLTGNSYSGRHTTDDEYVSNCTIYAVSETPEGPFTEPEGNILIGGIPKSGFTCRTVEMDGKRYLFYVDRPEGIETISLPKEIKAEQDGHLGVYWTEIAEKLRSSQLISPDSPPELTEKPFTSFAWKTLGGVCSRNGKTYKISTSPRNWQAAGFQIPAGNFECNIDIKLLDAKAAGIWVASRSGEKCRNYIFMIEPEKQRFCLTEFYNFEILAARKYPFINNEIYHLKLLMIEGTCEIYINQKLLLQCGIEMFSENVPGLFCDWGKAEFSNVSLYELGSV